MYMVVRLSIRRMMYRDFGVLEFLGCSFMIRVIMVPSIMRVRMRVMVRVMVYDILCSIMLILRIVSRLTL